MHGGPHVLSSPLSIARRWPVPKHLLQWVASGTAVDGAVLVAMRTGSMHGAVHWKLQPGPTEGVSSSLPCACMPRARDDTPLTSRGGACRPTAENWASRAASRTSVPGSRAEGSARVIPSPAARPSAAPTAPAHASRAAAPARPAARLLAHPSASVKTTTSARTVGIRCAWPVASWVSPVASAPQGGPSSVPAEHPALQ